MSEIKKTRFLPPYGVLTAMAVMYLLDKFIPLLTWQNSRVIAYFLMISSFLCVLYCAYVFNKYETEIKPFEESKFLILSWPYTLSRNPIYLCMFAFLLGWGLFLQSISAFIVIAYFAIWIHKRFVLQEEMMLKNKFSNEYLAYTQRVRRWL